MHEFSGCRRIPLGLQRKLPTNVLCEWMQVSASRRFVSGSAESSIRQDLASPKGEAKSFVVLRIPTSAASRERNCGFSIADCRMSIER